MKAREAPASGRLAPKILLVITQSELGGAQRYVLTLAVDLDRRGGEVVVACGEGGELVEEVSARGLEVLVLPYLVRPIRLVTDCLAVVRLARLIRLRRFDIVHLNSTKAGIVGRLAARLGGARVVLYTVHGLVLNEPMSKPQFLLYWFIERLGALLSSHMIAVSEADRRSMVRWRIAREAAVSVVHNGIDVGVATGSANGAVPAARVRLGLPDQGAIVGTVANLYRTKALDQLMRAAALVVRRHPDVQFVVVGEGSERPALESLIVELQIGDRMHLAGSVPNARAVLPAMDLFVLPSRKEGLPMALLEAMAAERPVIVTDVGGIPEVVDASCGVVVTPENPEVLADAIVGLLADPARAARLGEAGRRRVATAFTEQRMLEETVDIYNRQLHRVGSAARLATSEAPAEAAKV